LLELYRLVCQKLQGTTCAWCEEPFSEGTASGLFDGVEQLTFPATVPKVFVPQCGHAIHTLCFGSQLIPDRDPGVRGDCRRCGMPYAWTAIDVDPMVNAFCLLFGPYVDKRAKEMSLAGTLSQSVIISISEVCISFSLELAGLVSSVSAWELLCRRHTFSEPETVRIIGEEVLRLLCRPPEGEEELCEADDALHDGDPGSPFSGEELEDRGAPMPLLDEVLPLLPPPASPEALPVEDHAESESCDSGEEEPLFQQEPSEVMLSQIIAGCSNNSSLHGLMPDTKEGQ